MRGGGSICVCLRKQRGLRTRTKNFRTENNIICYKSVISSSLQCSSWLTPRSGGSYLDL